MKKERKIGRNIFIGLLGIQALLELIVGLTILFDFPTTLKNGFGITYQSELDILGIALGLYVLLLTSLLIISMLWTIRNNISGITIGVVAGVFLFCFGMAAFLKTGDSQGLLVDGLRGLLTVIFGYVAYKEIKK